MIYIVSIILIVIAYHIGKCEGFSAGESESNDRKYYLYAPQIDSYEQGYKDGVRETKEKYFFKD